MKNKTVKALALLMTVTTVSMMGASSIYASDTETTTEAAAEETEAAGEESADADQQAADNVAALIDKIYVQERTETTDDDCKAAKKPGMPLPMHRKSWWKARMPARITLDWTPETLPKMMHAMQMRLARTSFWQ